MDSIKRWWYKDEINSVEEKAKEFFKENSTKYKEYNTRDEFEKDLNVEIPRMEIALLNSFILKKQFNLAIFISNCYSFLYNNNSIKNIYRKFNNSKNG